MRILLSLFFLLNFLSLNAQKSMEFESKYVNENKHPAVINGTYSTDYYSFYFVKDKMILKSKNGTFLCQNDNELYLEDHSYPSESELKFYIDQFNLSKYEFYALKKGYYFENWWFNLKSFSLQKFNFGESDFNFIDLEKNYDELRIDKINRRIILNGESKNKPFYCIISIDDFKLISEGKGKLLFSETSGNYYILSKLPEGAGEDYSSLIELNSKDLKSKKELKGIAKHVGNLGGSNDYDIIRNNYRFIILQKGNNSDFEYYDDYNSTNIVSLKSKSAFTLDKLNGIVFERNLLSTKWDTAFVSDYQIHDYKFNSDSTKIFLLVDKRNPTAKKTKEIAEEKEKIRLAKEAEAKLIAEENKRLKEIKEAEEKIIAAENNRLNDLKIAEEKRQRQIKDSISNQLKIKEQLARIDKFGFKLVEKNKALKKLELKNITFKEKGHGLFTDFKKSGKDEVFYIFNHEAIVVMDTKNNTTKLFEYPSTYAYGAEIRQMYNGLFIYSDFGNRKVFILDLDKGIIRKTYSSTAENNPNVIFSQLGITNWVTESKYYLSFNLVGDSLVFNSEGNLEENDNLYSNQMPDQKIDESKINFNEGLKFVIDRSQGISNFDSKTQKRGNVEWNSFMSIGKQSMYGFFFLGLYKYHSPSFYKDYIAFGSEYSISSIGTTDYYDLKGFYIDKNDKKIEKEDLPSLLLYNSSSGKKDYSLHTITDLYYHYTMDKLSVYSCSHKYYNMGPSFNDPSVIILAKSDEGHDYLFKMKDTTILQIYDLASAKQLEITSELRKLKGIYTLKKQSGILYNNINDVPRTQKWKDEQAYTEKRNREFEEKEAKEKIQQQKNAEANKQQYQAKVLYTSYNSEYKLKIEVQANLIYVLEEVVDPVFQNKKVTQKRYISATPLYYRFPGNNTQWFSASSMYIDNCSNIAFSACMTVNGMYFKLGNPSFY
jgi:hypothetical protein